MKIKTKKTMDILELAQAVRNGEVKPGKFLNQENELINVDISGINLNPDDNGHGDYIVLFEDLFEVETLEELTEETPIPLVLIGLYIYENTRVAGVNHWGTGVTLKSIKENYPKSEFIAFYDLSTRKLIWSKENGFADGALEVEK